jgi:hypothetical protein
MNAARLHQIFTAKNAVFLILSLSFVAPMRAAVDNEDSRAFGNYTQQAIQAQITADAISNSRGGSSTNINATGMAAMHALAGEKAGALIFRANPKNAQEGVKAGLLFRGLAPIGDKISETVQQEVGDLWVAVVGGLLRNVKESILYSWYWLFNGGAKPYVVPQLERWKKEVLSVVLNDLDRNAKESQRESTTGRNAQMRSLFDASGEQDPNAVAEMAREKDPVWQRIVDGYARDLERLAGRLEYHKIYYAPQDAEDEQTFPHTERYDIIQLSVRLQETLRLLKDHVLLPTGTLKELAEGETRYFLPQLRVELENRFDLLIASVQDYHGGSHQTLSGRQKSSAASSGAPATRAPRPAPVY